MVGWRSIRCGEIAKGDFRPDEALQQGAILSGERGEVRSEVQAIASAVHYRRSGASPSARRAAGA
jgi:hypothetical protein